MNSIDSRRSLRLYFDQNSRVCVYCVSCGVCFRMIQASNLQFISKFGCNYLYCYVIIMFTTRYRKGAACSAFKIPPTDLCPLGLYFQTCLASLQSDILSKRSFHRCL